MNDIFLPRPGTSSFDLTARLYGGEDAWLRAKNNGRTELDYVQWVQVRTPEFKEAYGDWEGLLHKQFLEDNPVCRVYGNEIPKFLTFQTTPNPKKPSEPTPLKGISTTRKENP